MENIIKNGDIKLVAKKKGEKKYGDKRKISLYV